MVTSALQYAEKYSLFEAARSHGFESPEDISTVARKLCEQILDEQEWNTYYLHNAKGTIAGVRTFKLSTASLLP